MTNKLASMPRLAFGSSWKKYLPRLDRGFPAFTHVLNYDIMAISRRAGQETRRFAAALAAAIKAAVPMVRDEHNMRWFVSKSTQQWTCKSG